MERRTVLTLGFIVLTGISAVSMFETTWNYSAFFPAVQNLSAKISQVEVEVAPDNSSITLHAIFEIQNPKEYKGLSVAWYEAGIAFKDGAKERLRFGSIPFDGYEGDLAPHTPIEGIVRYEVPGLLGSIIAELQLSNRLWLQFEVVVGLSTFMDQIAALSIEFRCTTNGEPVDCQSSTPRVRYRFASGPSIGA